MVYIIVSYDGKWQPHKSTKKEMIRNQNLNTPRIIMIKDNRRVPNKTKNKIKVSRLALMVKEV